MAPFFYSDPHYGHANIIKYCKRPFTNADEMDRALIRKYKAAVSDEDTIYICGDFAFYKDQGRTRAVIHELPGKKKFVLGNHDKYLETATLDCFDEVRDYYEVYVPDVSKPKGKQMIVLSHYPFMVWNKSHHGSWSLHGHCHGSLPEDKHTLRLDVGVDCHGFAPVSYARVNEIMARKQFKPIDRHGED